MLHLSTIEFQWDTKGHINPPSHNKSYIHVIIDALVTLLLQYPSNQTTQRLLSKLSYTIGLLNLDHPYILSLIVDQYMLIKKWIADCSESATAFLLARDNSHATVSKIELS